MDTLSTGVNIIIFYDYIFGNSATNYNSLTNNCLLLFSISLSQAERCVSLFRFVTDFKYCFNRFIR